MVALAVARGSQEEWLRGPAALPGYATAPDRHQSRLDTQELPGTRFRRRGGGHSGPIDHFAGPGAGLPDGLRRD